MLVPKHDIFSESLKSEGIFENVIVDPRFPENIQKSTMVADTTRAPGLLKVFSVIVNIVNMIRLLCGSPKIVKANGIDIIYCNGTLAKIVGTLIGRKNKKTRYLARKEHTADPVPQASHGDPLGISMREEDNMRFPSHGQAV